MYIIAYLLNILYFYYELLFLKTIMSIPCLTSHCQNDGIFDLLHYVRVLAIFDFRQFLYSYQVGELIGGSQREERLDYLENRLDELKLDKESFWWYLDLRRFGSGRRS